MKKILSLIGLVISSNLLVISCNYKSISKPNASDSSSVINRDNKDNKKSTESNNSINDNSNNNSNNPNMSSNNNNQTKPNVQPINPTNINQLNYQDNKIYDPNKDSDYFRDSHLFSLDFLLNNSAYTISRSTSKFHTATHNINTFLKTGYYNNPVDFRNVYDQETDNRFWEHIKNRGWYGDLGLDDEQKTAFYNDHLSINGMVEQQYLDKFNKSEINSSTDLNFNFNELISKNPFGYLPSNLSQLFYYMDFKSISKLFKISNIKDIKANFDDKNGEFEILLTTNDKNYYQKIDKNNTNKLKKDLDYYQYIYDRSFSILIWFNRWKRDKFGLQEDEITKDFKSGTVWVLDRVLNKELENKGYYELLLATNIHVFSLAEAFDKSIYFEKNSKHKFADSWKADFFDYENVNDSKNAEFMTTRAKQEELTSNIINNVTGSTPTFKAESQYLQAAYYTPRYNVSGFKTNDLHTGLAYIENFNKTTRLSSTKNGGADFVILKLQIQKDKLKNILPKLDKVINTDKEKDWYIGLGKDELFTPLKTQFYAGYPATQLGMNRNLTYKFQANKSIGGVISTQNRYVNENNFQSLWTKYDADENKDWNSHNDNWTKYTEPFIENQHGMLKRVLTQHSSLYTRIEKEDDALVDGSSGSMAIDSSFNLIGINYLLSKDEKHNTTSNAISLIQGQSTYSDDFNGNLRTDFVKKLKKDNLLTVKYKSYTP